MSQVLTQIVVDESEGKTHVNRVQDCEPILRSIDRIRCKKPSKDLRHVARIPAVIVEQYCNRVGITFREFTMNPVHADRMLQDRDLAFFRTNPG